MTSISSEHQYSTAQEGMEKPSPVKIHANLRLKIRWLALFELNVIYIQRRQLGHTSRYFSITFDFTHGHMYNLRVFERHPSGMSHAGRGQPFPMLSTLNNY